EKGKKSRQKKKCKQFRIDTSSLNRKNHITLSDAIKFDLICVSLFIPERGTYNEDAAKQVANAYWKAEEAAQEAARLQRIKAEGETQEGRWYQSGSSSPRQERTVQELRDYFNNMENSPGYQAVQYIRKNPGGSSFVKDMVDVIRPLNSGFGTVFTIAADYLGEKQAGLTGYNSVTHQFYGPDEQRDILVVHWLWMRCSRPYRLGDWGWRMGWLRQIVVSIHR
ncbi:MAG: hypothetical protein ING31_10365, partial [Burkholderiales bacterium]|nr:hypothetical protein [Burkholderiales bacterium]